MMLSKDHKKLGLIIHILIYKKDLKYYKFQNIGIWLQFSFIHFVANFLLETLSDIFNDFRSFANSNLITEFDVEFSQISFMQLMKMILLI